MYRLFAFVWSSFRLLPTKFSTEDEWRFRSRDMGSTQIKNGGRIWGIQEKFSYCYERMDWGRLFFYHILLFNQYLGIIRSLSLSVALMSYFFFQAVTEKRLPYPEDLRKSLENGVALCEWVSFFKKLFLRKCMYLHVTFKENGFILTLAVLELLTLKILTENNWRNNGDFLMNLNLVLKLKLVHIKFEGINDYCLRYIWKESGVEFHLVLLFSRKKICEFGLNRAVLRSNIHVTSRPWNLFRILFIDRCPQTDEQTVFCVSSSTYCSFNYLFSKAVYKWRYLLVHENWCCRKIIPLYKRAEVQNGTDGYSKVCKWQYWLKRLQIMTKCRN